MQKPNMLLVKLSPALFLKSERTRIYMIKKLRENILLALKKNNIKAELKTGRLRMFLYSEEKEKCADVLKKVFGLHSVAFAFEFEFGDLEELTEKAAEFFKGKFSEKESFAVRSSRTGMHYFSSQEVERKTGARIVKEHGLKVNLSKPDKTLFIEIINNKAYAFTETKKCFDGLPTGVEGNIAMQFQGKKEENACAWLLLRKGCNVFPIAVKEKEKIEKQVKKLVSWNAFREFRVSKEKELKELKEKYCINAIATADTQVTKKAFEKYREENKKSELPMLRPLLFLEKEKLEKIQNSLKKANRSI